MKNVIDFKTIIGGEYPSMVVIFFFAFYSNNTYSKGMLIRLAIGSA
ncbi:MAG: hypothetical protein K6B41_03235 [Butyrivibrio sp.]|nr:hypothetical protein [Butyrivibrio sp.]